MPTPQQPQRRVSKKMQQFLDEMNEVFAEWKKRYQYRLEARVSYTPQGILPSIAVIEIDPPKRKKTKGMKKKGSKE